MKFKLFSTCLCIAICCTFLFMACNQEKTLSREEAVAFAKELEKAIKNGEGDLLDNSINKKEFIKKMNLPDNEFARGFANGIEKKQTDIGKQLSANLSDRDNFEFIKIYEKAGRQHILFRLFTEKDESLNYHDMELIKIKDKCQIADIYIYYNGENLSATMSNMFKNLYPEFSDFKNKLEDKKVDDLKKIVEIKNLILKGKNDAAKKIYDSLPQYLKETKMALIQNIIICSALTNEEYKAAIDAFRNKFPDEPNMNLMMINGYYLQQDYPNMLAAVNALDSQINKDPILDYHRHLCYNLMEDIANSKSCLKRLIKNKPDFQKGYVELIAVDLINGNNTEADSLISVYKTKRKFDQQKLDDVISYYRN